MAMSKFFTNRFENSSFCASTVQIWPKKLMIAGYRNIPFAVVTFLVYLFNVKYATFVDRHNADPALPGASAEVC